MAGRPLDPTSPRSKSFRPLVPIGEGGTAVYGGYVVSNEKDSRLIGRQRYKTFGDIVVNLSIVAAGVRHFLNLVAKAGWKVEPNEDAGDEGERAAELIESVMKDMTTSWTRVVRGAATYRFYGFSVQEWTAKKRKDGALGLMDIERRPQVTIERWDVDETGTVLGMWQTSEQTGKEIYLPRGKVVYLVDDTLTDSPEGLGLFRHLVEPAKRLTRYHQLEGFGFESDLRGTPVVRAPLTYLQQLVEANRISPEQKKQLEQPLRDFLKSHIKNPELGIMLDSQTYISADDAETPSAQPLWNVELLKGEGGQAHEVLANAIERLNRELARILNVEQLLLGEGDRGSMALSRDKTQALGLVVDSALTELAEQFEKDIVIPILALNGFDAEEVKPKLKTESVQFRDVEQIAKVLSEIASAGSPLAPDDPAIGEIRDLLGLTAPDLESLMRDAALRREAEQAQLDAMRAEGGGGGGKPSGNGDGDGQVDSEESGTENQSGEDKPPKPKPKPKGAKP